MKYITLFIFFLLTLSHPLLASPIIEKDPNELIINNRILAKVNGKTISVIDLMKKMEMQLNRYYPDYANSNAARFQFFSARWKDTLDEMIDSELMIADAVEKKIDVTDAEVRETMQERFGPNIVATLDKMGLTYDEARQMVQTEMVVQRMQWYKINAKAIHVVGPEKIKTAYKEYCIQNPALEEWTYQVFSIRTQDKKIGEKLADEAYQSLLKNAEDLSLLAEKMRAQIPEDAKVSITVSQDFEATNRDISEAHYEALASATTGTYTKPLIQQSRTDNSAVFRIFYLKKHSKKNPPAFEEISAKLEDALVSKAIGEHAAEYLTKLRKHYGYSADQVKENVPENFQPFSLR